MEDLTRLEAAALEEMREGTKVSIFHPSDIVAQACASLVRKGYAEINADGLAWVPVDVPNGSNKGPAL